MPSASTLGCNSQNITAKGREQGGSLLGRTPASASPLSGRKTGKKNLRLCLEMWGPHPHTASPGLASSSPLGQQVQLLARRTRQGLSPQEVAQGAPVSEETAGLGQCVLSRPARNMGHSLALPTSQRHIPWEHAGLGLTLTPPLGWPFGGPWEASGSGGGEDVELSALRPLWGRHPPAQIEGAGRGGGVGR